MNLNFLPNDIYMAILKLDVDKLTEIRLRIGFPILIFYNNKRYCLSVEFGYTDQVDNAVFCTKEHIYNIINMVCEYSIYAFNDRICDGYLTTADGVRIGIAGECVFNKDKIVTIKNFSSLNIRIPHEIVGCSKEFYNMLFEDGEFLNTLIISPPFCGKTTLLKDLAKGLDEKEDYSILIIDERGEFAKIKGKNIDTIRYSDKYYALNYGLRSLSPDVVITDELIEENDWLCINNAVNSGVKIVASVHSDSIESIKLKKFFIDGLFDRYILLDANNKPGVVNCVYDKNYLKL